MKHMYLFVMYYAKILFIMLCIAATRSYETSFWKEQLISENAAMNVAIDNLRVCYIVPGLLLVLMCKFSLEGGYDNTGLVFCFVGLLKLQTSDHARHRGFFSF